MRVWLGVVLLGLRPSLRWLRGSLTSSVRQLHRYYGAVRLLQNVRVRIMGLSPSRTGLLAQTLWRSPGSRAHCLLTCLDSSTTPSPAATRDLTRLADVSFPLTEKGRHPVACFRSSMIPPASPLSTLRYDPSRVHMQDSRPEWSRFSFSVGLSHPLQCAGLSRRSLSPGCDLNRVVTLQVARKLVAYLLAVDKGGQPFQVRTPPPRPKAKPRKRKEPAAVASAA